MSSVLLSKATDHYRHKRYELAAAEFAAANLERESEGRPLLSSSPSSLKNGNNSTPKSSSEDILFAALPKLSIAADAALSRFRSSMAKSALGQDQTALLLKAREANEDYGTALEGAIGSLASVSRKLVDLGGFSDRYQFIINKETVETSMAVLMTAVSGVWCYLHGAESEVTCNRMKSTRIVERGMQLSSCCFLGINPKLFLPTYAESLEVIDNVIQKMKELSPQNESQAERLEYVFHNIRHTSRIIGLTSNKERRMNKLEAHEGILERKRKRSKQQDMKVTNKRTKRNESDRLEIQENMVLILKQYIDKQDKIIGKPHVSSHSRKHSRDSFSQSAPQVQKDKLPGQLKSLLQGLDILSGNINGMGNHAVIYLSLESQSLVSKDAAFILGCLHMKLGDFKKAIQNFTFVLQLNRSSNRCDGMEKDTLSNIALCFALSGNLVPCLEVLLHRLGLDESDNAPRGIHPLQVELQPQMQNHDNSDMGKHLSVIWQTFFAGSLLADWGVCRKVLKELKEMSICNDYISLANAYVDLESKNLTKERIQSKPIFLPTPTTRFTEKAFLIYSAEFLGYLNEDDEYSDIDETTLTQILSMTSTLLAPSPTDRLKGKSRHGVLQATILNNHGFALVLNGKAVEAVSFFLEATKLCDQDGRGCSFPIRNLSFLLCQQGHKSEASKLYLKSKGQAQTF